MRKKVIRLTESDLEKLVQRIIKEVGGYDDPSIMSKHAGTIMGALSQSFNDLVNIVNALYVATQKDTTKEEMVGYLHEVIDSLDLFMVTIKTGIKDFTEDELITKAKFILKRLESFQNKLRVMVTNSDAMGSETEFLGRVSSMVQNLAFSLQEYGEELKITNDMFINRFNNYNLGPNN